MNSKKKLNRITLKTSKQLFNNKEVATIWATPTINNTNKHHQPNGKSNASTNEITTTYFISGPS